MENFRYEDIARFSEMYSVPEEDVFFIWLNLTGVNANFESNRCRFGLGIVDGDLFRNARSLGIDNFYCATALRKDSGFYFSDDGYLMFGKMEMAKISEPQPDFCESSYPRKEGKVINMNPVLKSRCAGCKFCHTAGQISHEEEKLWDEDDIRMFISNYITRLGVANLSEMEQVAIVSGCFRDEREIVDYIFRVRKVLSEFGYRNEIMYFGSQLKKLESLEKLAEIKPFSYYFTLECFERRKELLRSTKSADSLEDIKVILSWARDLGFNNSYSYIIGLDGLDSVEKYSREFKEYLTRFPVINVYQLHERQENLRTEGAHSIEYYLEARKILENIYLDTEARPQPYENYRALWYLKFADEILYGPRIPTRPFSVS
ncbi:MAG: radical SAM protein [Rickettsiales bacterium]|jgi:hypothetical protein|nr:radical SAM protein [Rickettsiales bacterium]